MKTKQVGSNDWKLLKKEIDELDFDERGRLINKLLVDQETLLNLLNDAKNQLNKKVK